MHYLITFILISVASLSSCTVSKNPNQDFITLNKGFKTLELKSEKHQSILITTPKDKNDNFCYSSCPSNMSKSNIEINHKDFLLSYSIRTKYADWVAYKIQPEYIFGVKRNRVWQSDPNLPIDIAMVPSDYKGANAKCNYDRGHQAPLADFSNSPSWGKVNYLSNITPQYSTLNQGAWKNLENKIRSLVKNKETNRSVYVLTGPYHNGKSMCPLPKARLSNIVPNGYWKIVTLVENNNIYRASFKFDQDTPKDANFCNYLVLTEDIAKIAKMNFNIQDKANNSPFLLQELGCNGLNPVN